MCVCVWDLEPLFNIFAVLLAACAWILFQRKHVIYSAVWGCGQHVSCMHFGIYVKFVILCFGVKLCFTCNVCKPPFEPGVAHVTSVTDSSSFRLASAASQSMGGALI
jgi:hypothetical protein